MSQRKEFVSLAMQEGANIRWLCRRFGISARTGYKWLERFKEEGEDGLADRSRRPWRSPRQTPAAMEDVVLKAYEEYHWAGRLLWKTLQDKGYKDVPSPSTINAILKRRGKLEGREQACHALYKRFERDLPNELWQMDFKGDFPMLTGRCHALTIVDDHSRFAVGLEACANQQRETVQECLKAIFRRYGLPKEILSDNGSPWGSGDNSHYTGLTVWLIRLGVRVTHGRAYHPQTQGKNERFNRTLKRELLSHNNFCGLKDCQEAFDRWRARYNLERPHGALGLQPPVSRYQPSPIPFPETLPSIEYDPEDHVRKVDDAGYVYYRGRGFRVGRAFKHQHVAVRPTLEQDVFDVYYCRQRIAVFSLQEDCELD